MGSGPAWRNSPNGTLPVFLRYRMRRVNCGACGVVVEEVPCAAGKHQRTKVYILAHWAHQLFWQETAASFWGKVCHSKELVVGWGLDWRRAPAGERPSCSDCR